MKISLSSLPIAAVALTLLFAAPAVRAQDDAAQRNAAVEDLLKAMHADTMMDNIIQKQKEAVAKILPNMLPKNASPEVVARVQAELPKILDTVYKQLTWESLKPDFVQIYSETFTVDEIKGLTAFYKTPLGQTLINKMPEVTQKSMLLMQKRIPGIMADMQKVIAEDLAKDKAGPDAQ